MSSTIPEDAPRPRLCHIKKWQGFNGYGFNLHAEKGKAGQYVGKVDPHSPAELAGLREGDRIVEVNGTNISNENHQQVVQRIKAIPNETKLLVVDHETDDYYKERKIVIRGDMPNVLFGESPDQNPADDKDDMMNNADKHSTHSSHSDNAMVNADHPYKLRLCHLRLWPDFQGYGFNLHAKKNQPGQYVGKVDDGSPAEAAGLREKDRILEVNGQSVVNDSHQAAVMKIKSIPNETKILVVDPEADEYFKEHGISLHGRVPFILHLSTPERKLAEDMNARSEDALAYKPRLIQLETWHDYNGYGFNMQSIKQKPGEYIGKVEPGSPAHVAGLKEGDRIIEVGGQNIENHSHNDVVNLIKAAGGRALLLVVDADADRYYKERGIIVNSNMPNIMKLECPVSKPQANGVSELSQQESEEADIVTNGISSYEEPVAHHSAEVTETTPTPATKDEDVNQENITETAYDHESEEPDYEMVDGPTSSPSQDNNNDADKDQVINEEDSLQHQQQQDDNQEQAVFRAPTPEQQPPSYVESQSYPDVQSRQQTTEVSTPSSPENPKSPVTIAGIEFAPSAEEARRRVSGRKKDIRHSQNLSAKQKYDLFQRL